MPSTQLHISRFNRMEWSWPRCSESEFNASLHVSLLSAWDRFLESVMYRKQGTRLSKEINDYGNQSDRLGKHS